MRIEPHPFRPGVMVSEAGAIFRDGKRVGLTPAPSSGYVVLMVRKPGGGWQTVGAHVLVCETFHGPRPPGMQAAHRNGVRSGNRAENLRWATRKENWADRAAHGTETRGSQHGHAKLTEADVAEIRQFVAANGHGSQRIAARRYGVSDTAISAAVNRTTWTHVA